MSRLDVAQVLEGLTPSSHPTPALPSGDRKQPVKLLPPAKWFNSIRGHWTVELTSAPVDKRVTLRDGGPVKLNNGRNGWMLLAVGIGVWDMLVEDTLSEAFSRAMGSKRCAPVLIAVWTVLTAHLFDLLPRQLDPFNWLLKGAKYLPKVAYL